MKPDLTDKDTWWQICRVAKPEMTYEEFEEAWEECQREKQQMTKQKEAN